MKGKDRWQMSHVLPPTLPPTPTPNPSPSPSPVKLALLSAAELTLFGHLTQPPNGNSCLSAGTGSEKGRNDYAENFIRERVLRPIHHPPVCPSVRPAIYYLFSYLARCVSIHSPARLLSIHPSSPYSPPTVCPSASLPTVSPAPRPAGGVGALTATSEGAGGRPRLCHAPAV